MKLLRAVDLEPGQDRLNVSRQAASHRAIYTSAPMLRNLTRHCSCIIITSGHRRAFERNAVDLDLRFPSGTDGSRELRGQAGIEDGSTLATRALSCARGWSSPGHLRGLPRFRQCKLRRLCHLSARWHPSDESRVSQRRPRPANWLPSREHAVPGANVPRKSAA